ncbi:MAG TPA: metalloregulator ArsR/SmtB family transcription factor [Candidatus Limnocylindria bacterium]|nr:metalloregulator ArsR/SmtB family transcription factor [Candidatus Limnocylindria bacterium]
MKPLLLAAKTLSDPTRIRVLVALREGGLCVCELCDALDVTQSTLSSHLQVIRNSGLAETRREGKWMYYTLTDPARKLLEGFFGPFETVLAKDAKIRSDAVRLKKRLAARQQGVCCLGFNTCG